MNRDRVERYLRDARKFLEEGDRESALEFIRKALAADPGEMTITEVLLEMERSREVPSADTASRPPLERTESSDMDPKLEKAFRLSDEALDSGNEAKALAYLKKAVTLFPDEPEAAERLEALKTRIRAGNLVAIGMKKLEEGDLARATVASRKAFQLMPDAAGLQELLSGIEMASESDGAGPEPASGVRSGAEDDLHDAGAMLWIDRIRAAIKAEKFEEAGQMVTEAVRNHPGDPLLGSFHIKLKRLGFAE